MSLNELTLVQPKPWLNIKANNLVIDGELSVLGGVPGSVLNYSSEDEVKFSPLKIINEIEHDFFDITPQNPITDGLLQMTATSFTPTNFTLNSPTELECTKTGVYFIFIKYAQATGQYTSRPNPYLSINGTPISSTSIRIPLATGIITASSGYQTGTILSLSAGNLLNINLATQPTGNVSMANITGISNIFLLNIA